ncbi:exported hypothetical protein [Cupriavidus taiwanensis]|nr:exported hypothetical protein [Cupriavidus taiwanensis]SPA56389.1 exported protein of unknown function [Cupriavidus taiwanensis]
MSAPNTVIAAASRGSIAQAQNDIATMPKAKPDRPWTKPATAAPAMTISKVESKGTGKDARGGRCRAHNYALPCPRCQPSALLRCGNLIRCFCADLMLFRVAMLRYDLPHWQRPARRNKGCARPKVRRFVTRPLLPATLPFAARAAYTTLTARACAPAPPARFCLRVVPARFPGAVRNVQGTRQASATENTTCLV